MKQNRKKLIGALTLVLVLALAACSQRPAEPLPAGGVGKNGVVSGQVLVKPKSVKSLDALREQYSVTAVSERFQIYLLKGDTLIGNEDRVTQHLKASGEFDMVQPNYLRSVNVAFPRDTMWLDLYALKNYGQDAPNGIQGRPGADIHALGAWKKTTGSADVVVAILDTGIDYTHPDLKDNMWVNEKERNGKKGEDDDGNGYADDIYGWDFVSFAQEKLYRGKPGDQYPMDDHGHGTHVAGTIGAVGNNNIGITGINWTVKLMALKFLNQDGSGESIDEIQALEYAIASKDKDKTKGVDIINASFGGGSKEPMIEMLLHAVEKAGILFVAASGNDENDNDVFPHYPSNYAVPSLISVAASDNLDQLANFSNYGYGSVHIAAPGVSITSTYPVELAKKENNSPPYRSWSGTSMATPHVVGAAALVLAADPSLKSQPLALKTRLMKSVDWLPQFAGRVASGGRLNLERAVNAESGEAPVAFAQEEWIEEPLDIQTPPHATERLNFTWTVERKGARALQLHVQRSVYENVYDMARIFDGLYRPIAFVPSMARDHWLPPVLGDKVFFKFDNGMVSIETYRGQETTDDPAKYDPEQNVICFRSDDSGPWTCNVWEKPTPAQANHRSPGISIDRVRYLPAVAGGQP